MIRYTLRQLEYFIAAGETCSITLASERIHISQPSISTAISHLERELETQLFVRHHAQGLSLTPAGDVLLQQAKAIVEQAQSLYGTASDLNQRIAGNLSVGCMLTLAPMIMPELTRSFGSSNPGCVLQQVQGDQKFLIDQLRRAELDIAITYDDFQFFGSAGHAEEIDFIPLVKLPPHVVVSADHPLATRRSVTLSELVPYPMILLDLPLSRDYFHEIFAEENLKPNIAARSPYPDVVRAMVANNHGFMFYHARPKCDLALDGRRTVRLDLVSRYRVPTVGIAALAHIRRSRLIDAFVTHCQGLISDTSIPGMVAPFEDRAVA